LASETDGLPKNFAAHVAALAEGGGAARRGSWNDLVMLGAFVAMIGVCVAGWFSFGPQVPLRSEWLKSFARVVASQPWLLIAVAGAALVQVLNFRRRVMT